MRITIEYDSSWRNSFLGGENDEPLPKKGREFVGSMTALKKEGNFKSRPITLSTVMGVMNRLIGDQRKLYQARNSKDYFFKDEEGQDKITFDDVERKKITSNEMIYIRNMKGSTDQNSFSGILKTQHPMFTSDYSGVFWGILELEFNDLCQFILNGESSLLCQQLDPIYICGLFDGLSKLKAVENAGIVTEVIQEVAKHFPEEKYTNSKGLIIPSMLYCTALYLQLKRLECSFNMESAKTKSGGISGISKRSFTKKDFMKKFTTGKGKIIWGNPYMKKEKIKGQGEITSILTKVTGRLQITIDVDKSRAKEIEAMIEYAGVSAFTLGKKGLAYVSKIKV